MTFDFCDTYSLYSNGTVIICAQSIICKRCGVCAQHTVDFCICVDEITREHYTDGNGDA